MEGDDTVSSSLPESEEPLKHQSGVSGQQVSSRGLRLRREAWLGVETWRHFV